MAQSRMARSMLGNTEIQEASVEYLVLSGGGAKGVLYPGAYKAIEASGTMESIKGVAGSSAGAISAGLIATGMNATEFEELSSSLDMPSLLGKGVGPILRDGKPLEDVLRKNINKNVRNFLKGVEEADLTIPDQEVRNMIRDIASQRIEDVTEEQAKNNRKLEQEEEELANVKGQLEVLRSRINVDKLSPEEEVEFKSLQASLDRLFKSVGGLQYHRKEIRDNLVTLHAIAEDNPPVPALDELIRKRHDPKAPIFFTDLGLLNLLDPTKFKELHVTAVSKSTGELKIFNSKDSPNVEIALACKASASIPIVVKPTAIGEEKYVDGGYKDNVPFRAFRTADQQRKKERKENSNGVEDITDNRDRIMDARAQGKTLAFAFESDTAKMAAYSAGKNLYEPNRVTKFIADVVLKTLARVGGKWKYTQTERDTYNEIRENATNTILLNSKGVGTLDFNDAKRKQKYLYATGYIKTMEHFDNFKEGHKTDPDLKLKSFMLDVYDDVDKTQKRKFWQTKIPGTNANKKELLDFCMPETWKESQVDKIQEYIMTVAALPGQVKKGDDKSWLKADTASMKSLLKALNDKATSSDVKAQFARTLDLRDDKGQPIKKENVVNIVFSERDIGNFITKLTKDDIKKFVKKHPDLTASAKMQKQVKQKSSAKGGYREL